MKKKIYYKIGKNQDISNDTVGIKKRLKAVKEAKKFINSFI